MLRGRDVITQVHQLSRSIGKYMRLNFIGYGFFIFLCLISTYWWWVLEEQTEGEEGESTAPLFQLQNFTLKQFNVQGALAYILQAPTLTHLSQDKGTMIDEPNLNAYDQKKLSWLATGRQAWISPNHEQLRLQDNVVLIKQAPNDPTRIETEWLEIDQAGEHLFTYAPVSLQNGHKTLTGTGLEGWPRLGQFTILANVESVYLPVAKSTE